jgi:hypothetical protein
MSATRPSHKQAHRQAHRQAVRRRRLVVGGASVVFHGLLGWALLVGVPAPPVLVEPRSVVVNC